MKLLELKGIEISELKLLQQEALDRILTGHETEISELKRITQEAICNLQAAADQEMKTLGESQSRALGMSKEQQESEKVSELAGLGLVKDSRISDLETKNCVAGKRLSLSKLKIYHDRLMKGS